MKKLAFLLAFLLSSALLSTSARPAIAQIQAQERVQIRVLVPPLAFTGQTIQIHIETTFAGRLVDATIPTTGPPAPHIWRPDKGRDNLPPPERYAPGHFITTYKVPDLEGTYWAHVIASANGTTSTGAAAFLVLKELPAPAAVATTLREVDGGVKAVRDGLEALKGDVRGAAAAVAALTPLIQAALVLLVISIALQVVPIIRKK